MSGTLGAPLIPWSVAAAIVLLMLGGAVYVLAGALIRTRAQAAADRRALLAETLRAQRAEQLATGLLEWCPVGILLGDSDGTLRRASATLGTRLGYTPTELLAGTVRRRDITPPELWPEDEAALHLVELRGSCPPYRKEYLATDGQRVPVRSLLVRIGSGAQATLCEFITDPDSDERRQAEEERSRLLVKEQQARADAERASRMKDEFLATVSHELRTPLTAIMGWVHMLRTETLDDKTQAMAIQTVERNAKAQAQLIEDILDVSRIITGKLRLQVAVVDLLAVVQAAIDTVRPAAQSKDLELRLRCGLPPDERIVRGDVGRLQQVVWNLLANAIKFTPKAGRVDVTLDQVAARSGELEAGFARITVRDSGQGIESDFLPFVFDRFRQADGTMTRKHGGLGLGLAIVRHLVELHGGTAQASSAGPGQGAEFTVTLPREILPTAVVPGPGLGSAAELAATAADDAAGPPSLRGLSVLVVDDAPDTLRMLATLLGEAGAQVHTAESARAALALIPQHRPDVLVSDLAMPGEDGFALIAKVRALPPELGGELPAIALTAHVRVADRARALAAGFHMFIAKPLEPRELLLVISELAAPRRRA